MRMQFELDKDKDTPSDYALIFRDLNDINDLKLSITDLYKSRKNDEQWERELKKYLK